MSARRPDNYKGIEHLDDEELTFKPQILKVKIISCNIYVEISKYRFKRSEDTWYLLYFAQVLNRKTD